VVSAAVLRVVSSVVVVLTEVVSVETVVSAVVSVVVVVSVVSVFVVEASVEVSKTLYIDSTYKSRVNTHCQFYHIL
jgi:hypothetical protein